MNIAPLCVLIIITGGTDGLHVENIRAPLKAGERIPPRKLHSFEPNDPQDAKTATWNEILADALVNRIKIFSYNKVAENEKDIAVNNLLTNCISQMMQLYKTLVYDNINGRTKAQNDAKANGEKMHNSTELVSLETENGEKAQNNSEKVNIEVENVADPKDEVEIIEPKYHGKLCAGCDGTAHNESDNKRSGTSEIVKRTDAAAPCPAGLAADGGCDEPKSKFILSIPHQCPIGYRRDWIGLCRPQL